MASVSALSRFVLDVWSALSYKQTVGESTRQGAGASALAPTWVGPVHQRRLTAYRLLEAYYRNCARGHLPTTDENRKRDHREYGDANLLVKSVVAALLGEDPAIVVDGAEDDPGPIEDLPENPTDEDRARQAEAERRRTEAEAAIDRQEWLREWASPERERLRAKMLETERDAVKLGDGVYVLGWSSAKRRVRVRLYDPGMYFPVLDEDAAEDEFPSKVHVAWEWVETIGGKEVTKVRRLTWELAPIMPVMVGDGRGGQELLLDDDGGIVLRPGDGFDGQGRIVRTLPYSTEPTAVTCYMSDATWTLSPTGGHSIDDWLESDADWGVNEDGELLRRLDLGIDFLPVVHVPNTVAIKDHFGEALVTSVAQVLDDLAAADTDMAAATALASSPVVFVAGATGDNLKVRPGAVIGGGINGRMDVLDLSQALPALAAVIDKLIDRLVVNARLADEVLGRTKASDVASGILFSLTFGPLRSLIGEMRLPRDEKYPLLLKFVQRWAMVAGAREPGLITSGHALPPGEPLAARVEFGSFLPSDRKALIDEVVALYGANLISLRTALKMLQAGGVLDIDDVDDEVELIQAGDFEAANRLLDALGSEELVAAFLGLTLPERPEPAADEGGELVDGRPVIPLVQATGAGGNGTGVPGPAAGA